MDWIAAAVLASQLWTSASGQELTIASQRKAGIDGAFVVETSEGVNGTIGAALSRFRSGTVERSSCSEDPLLAPFAVKPASAGIARQRPSSRRQKIVAGALVGFGVGALLGVTVGQEMCLGHGKWLCVVEGGGLGAVFGILAVKQATRPQTMPHFDRQPVRPMTVNREFRCASHFSR